MERIGRDVRRELARFGPQAGLGDIVAVWPAAVGAQIAANAWPARVQRDGTLVVHTSSSSWAFELGHLERTLRERLGKAAPRALKFVVGPLPEVSEEPVRQPPVPSAEDEREAARLAARIADPDLREHVARAIRLSLARTPSDRPF